jgi:hypothetical protein
VPADLSLPHEPTPTNSKQPNHNLPYFEECWQKIPRIKFGVVVLRHRSSLLLHLDEQLLKTLFMRSE